MGNYILLRNNKQTGPHTVEELKEMGLKVYDLVWIEGKSTVWLYAEEIPELAPFTPKICDIVEESFLEKRATAKIPSVLEQFNKLPVEKNINPTLTNKPQQKEQLVFVQQPVEVQHKSTSTVAGSDDAQNKTKEVAVKKPVNEIISNEKPLQKVVEIFHAPHIETPVKFPGENIKKVFVDGKDENEQLSVKYTRSLDDIKQEYLVKVLGKPFTANKKSVPVMLLLGVGILLLVGVGIIIGLLLGNHSHQQQVVFTPPQKKSDDTKTVAKKTYTPVTTMKVPAESKNSMETSALFDDDLIYTDEHTIKPQRNTQGKKAKKETKTPPAPKHTLDTEEWKEPAGVQSTVKKEYEKNHVVKKVNLRESVVISAKDYRKTGVFGGLKDITVTAFNKSAYTIDLAVVEVYYILANGKVFKTEILYFKNLAPGATVSQKASNSPRGVKIESKLTLVSSKTAESISDISYLY